MIKTVSILHDELKNYSNIKSKIQSLCNSGDLYPLVRNRGIYETDGSLPGYCLALIINGPSYLSFEFALSRHGLIPEAVYAFTSATFETGKKKIYTNHFGTFTYRDVPAEVFPLEVEAYVEKGYRYLLASPEKALCDKLYELPPCRNRAELSEMLFDDLRIDEEAFAGLDLAKLSELAGQYRCTNHRILRSLLRKDASNE